ncbi:PREDICTED: proteoglycan 4 isoform X2 [Ceratosolen solmsi marchali]|uniref:Proteoglycan 4 isoform X2 n=1 Tax=Ceratosolen solmsi marchali TaxID=326594 RepID=A0AAJ6YL77_9HYME|nr:PREDICTED: proteoglycan 4 isoform X2 [Ceratosolen solmsi marchali]
MARGKIKVQPGQSKTVAYKQISYHYDKKQEGKDLESWMKTDKLSKNDTSIVDNFCERTFEKSDSSTKTVRDSPDFAKSGKEIIYKADVSTKTIPTIIPTTETRSTERDFKYIKETSFHTEPSPVSPRKNIKTVRTDETEELTNVEYIPASAPIPANLAPGPNTKVTTTIKTYTYELPGAPETYLPSTSSTLTKNVNVDKSVSYTLPREPEKTVTYHVEEQKSGIRDYVSATPPPTTSRVHREEKVYMERRGYRAPSPPPPVTTTTTTTTSRNERYLQQTNIPVNRVPSPADYPDQTHSSRTERSQRIVYQSEPAPPPPVIEGTRTTIKQYEEHFSGSRPPKPVYYPGNESSHHSSSTTHIYKYDEQQSLLPKPFPTSERPASPRQQPPKRIEDLMASFSDSEEVVEVVDKRDRKTKESTPKKEVDFVPQTVPVVKSKNVAGPPVYYPPGSAEFSKKEEAMGAMSKASGGWAKERAAWEYGASAKSEEKVKTKKAVVPVCLPLCCALPCVIM